MTEPSKSDVYVTLAMCMTPYVDIEKFLMVVDAKPGPVANVEPTTIRFTNKQAFLDFLTREAGRMWDGYQEQVKLHAK